MSFIPLNLGSYQWCSSREALRWMFLQSVSSCKGLLRVFVETHERNDNNLIEDKGADYQKHESKELEPIEFLSFAIKSDYQEEDPDE